MPDRHNSTNNTVKTLMVLLVSRRRRVNPSMSAVPFWKRTTQNFFKRFVPKRVEGARSLGNIFWPRSASTHICSTRHFKQRPNSQGCFVPALLHCFTVVLCVHRFFVSHLSSLERVHSNVGAGVWRYRRGRQ